jgi:hypothetical protein
MAADAGEQLKETNRHLRAISSSLNDIARALKALNNNYADVHRGSEPTVPLDDAESVAEGNVNGS